MAVIEKYGPIPIYIGGDISSSAPAIAYANQVLLESGGYSEFDVEYLFLDCYGYKNILQKIKTSFSKNYEKKSTVANFNEFNIRISNYGDHIIEDLQGERSFSLRPAFIHSFNCNLQKINNSEIYKLCAYSSEEKIQNYYSKVWINNENNCMNTVRHVIYFHLDAIKPYLPDGRELFTLGNSSAMGSLLRNCPVVQHEIFKCMKDCFSVPILEEWMPYLLRESNTRGGPFIKIKPAKPFYADYNNPNNIYALSVTFQSESQLEKLIEAGLKNHEISIMNRMANSAEIDSVKNLNDYLNKFSDQLINKVSSKFSAVFDPEKESFNQREKDFFDYSEYFGKLKFFEAQKNVIAAVNRSLKTQRSAFIVGEMGCGKTALSIGATYANADKENVTNIVMCPGHLVEKWKREIERIYPNAKAFIITNFESLSALDREIRNPKRTYPLFMVISKDTAKINYAQMPAVSWDIKKEHFYLGEHQIPICTYSMNNVGLVRSRSTLYPNDLAASIEFFCNLFANKTVKNSATNCGNYGSLHYKSHPRKYDRPIQLWTTANNKVDNKWIKTNAGWINKDMIPLIKEGYGLNPSSNSLKKLYNAVMDMEINGIPPQVMPRRYSLAKYIRKNYGKIIDYFIADEVHLYSSSTSAQANAFGDLVRTAKKTIALTGTLLNGYADGIYYILYRMYSKKFKKDGYSYRQVDEFVNRYGVKRQTNTYENRQGWSQLLKKSRKILPGVSPKLFTEFLLDKAIFISLSDMSNALPKYTEHPIPIQLGPEEAKLYSESAQKIGTLLANNSASNYNVNEVAFQAAQRLNVYPDQPYDIAPICNKQGTILHEFKDYCSTKKERDNYVSMKDQKVLDIVQEKLEKGENVLIYVNYVNKTECVERLERILKEFNIKTCVLDASISASRREEWIDKKVKEGYRVLICNPTLVETGLDLLAFTNIIFYQVGYNLFTMRQASRRSLRLNQPNDVNVYFLYYAGTTQEAVLSLMANKLQASMAIEGKFTEEGLNAMSNNDSILTQIAESLVQNIEHKVEIGTFSSGIGRPEDDDGSRFKLIDMIMNKKKKELVYSFVKSCNKKKVVKTEFGIKNGKMKLAV
jgi:SNF2 family DNA or RNA helicase